MAFGDIMSLADEQAKADLEQRKQQILDLKQRQKDAAIDDQGGILGLVDAARKAGRPINLTPDAQKEYDSESLFREHRQKREQQSMEALTSDIPSKESVSQSWFGPYASLVRETPQAREDELSTDPRGRAARLEAAKAGLAGELGLTGPRGSDRPMMVGTGSQGEPYFTNLSREELHKEHHDVNTIRQVAGMDPIPPEPTDLHRLSIGSGAFSSTKSGFAERGYQTPEEQAKSDLMRTLDLEIGAARDAKLTPREAAAGMLEHEPKWDEAFSKNGYAAGKQALGVAIASGQVPPEIGAHLMQKYDVMMSKAVGSDPAGAADAFKEQLDAYRQPQEGQQEAAAMSSHSAMDASHNRLKGAVADNMDAAGGGPGTSISPMRKLLAGAARYGLPAVAALPSLGLEATGLGAPAGAALGAGAAGGGELLAELIGGENLSPARIGAAGAIGAIPGSGLVKPASLMGRAAYGAALGAGGDVAQRAAEGDTPSIEELLTAALTGGVALPVAGAAAGVAERATQGPRAAASIAQAMRGLGTAIEPEVVEGAGRGSSMASRLAAGQAQAPAEGPIPYLQERLPALRGGGFQEGRVTGAERATRGARGRNLPVPARANLPTEKRFGIEDLIRLFLESRGR